MDYASLPKAELHCHLIGVIDAQLLGTIAHASGECLVAPDSVHPVTRADGPDGFVAWLECVKPYQFARWRQYLPILATHIDNLVAQNVRYTEITISPLMFDMSSPERLVGDALAFQRASRALERARIQVEYLSIIPRSLPDRLIGADTENCLALHEAGFLSGVVVAGMDQGVDLARFAGMLRTLKDAGLEIEVHAGEFAPAYEVWTALDACGADRIGHGLSAFSDPVLVSRMARDAVHVEFCPSSNLCTGVVETMDAHPLRSADELGIAYSINTDDPGAFACTMTSEFALAGASCGLSESDFSRIFSNSLAARFAARRQEAPEERADTMAQRAGNWPELV